jgi:polysaccharide pyruvyl transferase WcaK-like protein
LQTHGYTDAKDIGDPYLWLQAPVAREPIPKHLGVNIGSTNNSLWGTTDDDLLKTIAEALKALEAQGWTLSFFSVWEKDLPLLERLRQNLRGATDYPILDARIQTLEAYSALAKCQVFLGEKLHANAMAAVAGTPFLALEYQPKVREFAQSVDMEEYLLSTSEVTPDLLVQNITYMAAAQATLRVRLVAARANRRRAIIDFADRVKAYFGVLGGNAL